MKYKLLVLDIDGTVTNSQKQVTERTRDAVIRLQKQGVAVVIASGRAPRGVLPIAETLQLHRAGSYILAFNGARIIHCQSRKCIFEKQLPRHIPARLWQDAKAHQLGILTYSDQVLIAGTPPDPYMAIESRISHMPVEYHPDFLPALQNPVNGCLLTGDPEIIETMEPFFVRKHFHETQIFRSEPFFLEVAPKNVDKAYSLKHLLRILGIRREEMVCCGDSFNDITMIQFAGLGVAMANGQQMLKDVANYVTRNDNDHDGIAEVIETFF